MTNKTLPGPDDRIQRIEHPAASPERVGELLRSIPEDDALSRLRRRHLISSRDLDAPLVRQLLRLAARYEVGQLADTHPARCKVLSNLFLDRSHCTGRLAFNAAWLRLGGSMLQLDSVVEEMFGRTHTPDEVVEVCNNYSDLTVLRTQDAGSFQSMLPHFRIPVVSAGNGNVEYPAHAIADLYMLAKWRPELIQDEPPQETRLQIGIVGDPSRTRTIRSLLLLLTHFPHAVERIVLLQRLEPGFSEGQREELEQAGLRVQSVKELFPVDTDMEAARKLLPTLDLLYVHHLQRMQVPRMQIVEAISLLKPEAMILNPETQNEETANRLSDTPHNGYFAQARGSVFVRMALFASILG